jgi:4-aminobutyrate aminotransferase
MTGPDIRTALPGPKAQAIIDRDAKAVSTSYTRDYPLVIERGEGAFVEDVDGNVFLDCTAGIAVTSTGHSHPEVVQAIVDQSRRFLHMSGTDFYYEPQVQLGEAPRRTKPRSSWRSTTRSGTTSSPSSARFTAARWARSR